MFSLEDEILRHGAAKIVGHREWYGPLSHRHRFLLDNGLYVTIIYGLDNSLVIQFILMGRADGSIATPPVDQRAKVDRAIRGYRRRVLGRSRKPLGGLPPAIADRLAQMAVALSNAGWWLLRLDCTDPGLLDRGFPAWRVVYLHVGGPIEGPHRVFRHLDTPAFAARILGQVEAMRRLLEDVRESVPMGEAEPG